MSEFLAEATVLVRPDTTKFRALLEAELAAATKIPVAVPVTPVVSGTGRAGGLAETAALNTTAIGQQNTKLREAGAEAQKTASATRVEATAAREAAKAHEQLARGGGATILSLLGIRGATLAASGSFLAGAAAITILAKSIHEASAESEALARVQRVLGGPTSKALEESAKGLANSFGLSATEALRSEGAFAELFHNVGIGDQRAGQLSERFVKLAADMAAFNNVPIDATLKAIQLGIAGNTRGLKQYGIILNQSTITQEALRESGKKFATDLTRQELVLARVNLILADTANQQGAFAARSADLAGQTRILQANLANLSASIGSLLIPVLVKTTTDINILFDAVTKLAKIPPINIPIKIALNAGQGQGGIKGFLGSALRTEILQAIPVFGPQIVLFKALDGAIRSIRGTADETGTGLVNMARDAGDASAAMDRLAEAAQHVIPPLKQLQTAVTGLELGQLKIQTGIAPGGRAAEEANLRQQIADQEKVVALAASGSKSRRQALEKLKTQQDALKALIDQDAADAQQRAADAKSAADKAKAARDAQDQALLTLFGTQQTRITDALISAGPKQAIALTIRLRNLFRRQREEARKQIKDLQLRAQTLLADTTEIKTLNKQIADLQKAQADALAAQIQQQRQDRLTHLEALLSIAETTPGTKDDVRRLKAIEAFDRARIAELKKKRRLTREEKQELDALRVDLAQREEALRGLTAQQKKNTQAQAEFNFLQTQTGFVQNLLGNLIPGSATGLVGGKTSSPGIQNVRPSINAANTASQLALGKPASAGQANVQIDVLRKILATLQELKKGSDHPEAKKQRHTGSAAMDYHIQGTYGM